MATGQDTSGSATALLHLNSPTNTPSRKRKAPRDEQPHTFRTSLEFLGASPFERLCIAYPPTDNENDQFSASILSGLQRVETIFKQPKIKRYLAKVSNDNKVLECRLIQGNRYEIFVKSKKYSSCIWYKILELGGFENPQQFTKDLVRYAEERALADPRVGSKRDEWKFDNFSLIATYSKVSQQEPHIDLLLPNYQFGVMVSDAAPSTWYYEVPPPDRIGNGKHLADLWCRLDPSMPEELRTLLEECPDINNKLESFGSVLCVSVPSNYDCNSDAADRMLRRPFNRHGLDHVRRGSVLSLPGSQVHAGPTTDSVFRAVLFFSGRPQSPFENDDTSPTVQDAKGEKQKANQSKGYDPDTQYSNVLLMASILQMLWRRFQISIDSRIYLLKRLKMYMAIARSTGASKAVPQWHHHFYDQIELRAMLKSMEARIIKEENKIANPGFALKTPWDEFYKEHAENEYMSSLHLETVEYVGEFRVVSAKGLKLEYDDTYHPASIFQRDVDNRVVIYYWHSNDWEGSKKNDHYKIEWKDVPEDAFKNTIEFDGSNGVLLDTDGNAINVKQVVEAHDSA